MSNLTPGERREKTAEYTIAASWLAYMDTVIPAGASARQISESKRAFYGGAAIVLAIVASLGADDVSEDTAVDRLGAMTDEVNVFLKGTIRGEQ